MAGHLLLAEDDHDIRAVATLALRREGFDVTAVADGEAVLACVHAARPDAIVLDWMMPTLDGPSTCAALRADGRTAGLPVIFLTAKSDPADVTRMRELGARGHIAKPFNPLALASQVRALLDPSQSD